MKARHIALCLVLSLLGAGLQAQDDLPQEYVTAAGDTVWYVYSADGEKLFVKKNLLSGPVTGTEYAANYRIENGTLAMIHTDAGYYTPVTSPGGAGSPSYLHVWYLKDHLGNNRVLADGSGKEWSVPTSTYDFEARQFSPYFHRFTSMDPLCEKYYGISPYAYCKDNPVNRIDPNGRIDKEWLKKGGTTLGAGLVATIGGGLAVSSGAGVAPGAYALSTGISAIGLGVGMILIGLSTDPTPEGRQKLEMMPTGVANAIGKSSDQVLGTKNHEVEMIANFIDATIGLGTLAEPQTPIESVVNLITIVQAGAATKKVGEMLMEEQSSSRGMENNDLPIIHKNWKQDLEESSLWKSSEYQL